MKGLALLILVSMAGAAGGGMRPAAPAGKPASALAGPRVSVSPMLPRTDTAASALALNEILADPPADSTGDANGDGVRDSQDDEFVEIMNAGPEPVNLAGWAIRDSIEVRHVFPDSVPLMLGAGELATVFGGGRPTGFTGLVFTASTGKLSLNNSGELVALVGPDSSVVDSLLYGAEGGRDRSLVRLPDGTGDWHLAGDLGSRAPHSAHLPNSDSTARQPGTWGQLKIGFTRPAAP